MSAMDWERPAGRGRQGWVLLGVLVGWMRLMAVAPPPVSCQKVMLTGEVSAGQQWQAAIGQYWVLRVMPIEPARADLSGWDLIVDREQPAGYPDALLLATPPYDSINEREVGTTFGMRAQDVIGWNPRGFRFLTDADLFRRAQERFRAMHAKAQGRGSVARDGKNAEQPSWMTEVLNRSSAGQFRILDARLTPGTADAAPYAENWAVAGTRTPHTMETAPGGKATPRGRLNWIRFSVTLWMPEAWPMPAALHAAREACSE